MTDDGTTSPRTPLGDAERLYIDGLKKWLEDDNYYSNSPKRDWLPDIKRLIALYDARDAMIATQATDRAKVETEQRNLIVAQDATIADLREQASRMEAVLLDIASMNFLNAGEASNLAAGALGWPVPEKTVQRLAEHTTLRAQVAAQAAEIERLKEQLVAAECVLEDEEAGALDSVRLIQFQRVEIERLRAALEGVAGWHAGKAQLARDRADRHRKRNELRAWIAALSVAETHTAAEKHFLGALAPSQSNTAKPESFERCLRCIGHNLTRDLCWYENKCLRGEVERVRGLVKEAQARFPLPSPPTINQEGKG